jgi:hypothetical protein
MPALRWWVSNPASLVANRSLPTSIDTIDLAGDDQVESSPVNSIVQVNHAKRSNNMGPEE